MLQGQSSTKPRFGDRRAQSLDRHTSYGIAFRISVAPGFVASRSGAVNAFVEFP